MITKELRTELSQFKIEEISENNINDVYKLLLYNTYYFEKTQNHAVSKKESLDDAKAVPPGKSLDDKTYVVIYKENVCVGVVDFIEKYPDNKTGFIGLLIINNILHSKGLGTKLLNAIEKVSKSCGFEKLELGCYIENEIGFIFWKKKGFCEEERIERVIDNRTQTLVKMSKSLKEGN